VLRGAAVLLSGAENCLFSPRRTRRSNFLFGGEIPPNKNLQPFQDNLIADRKLDNKRAHRHFGQWALLINLLTWIFNRSTASQQHFNLITQLNYFLNLFLANIPIPINPEPSRNIVAGSGTEAVNTVSSRKLSASI
jgi:hypothetical protein